MRSLKLPARWRLAPTDGQQAARLASELGLSPLAARVLLARGLHDPLSARRFLNPSLDDLHDPLSMRDMDVAVDRLRRAIAERQPLLLYGDYDVDGATSVVMLHKAIELAGHRASVQIPHRLREGYGLHTHLVEQAASEGVRLIVSLDTGVRAHEAIRRARELGVDVIVVDHHLPDRELPPALALLNPRRSDCPYPEKNLTAAGLTLKLTQALLAALDFSTSRREALLRSFVKLAAIGTVADVAPLTGENRILVKHGLEGLRSVRNPGLRELLKAAGFAEGDALTAEQVAFRLAPRMNAAGRMDHASSVVRLLLTDQPELARELAGQLEDWNRRRQAAEEDILRQVEEQCLQTPVRERDAALVFLGPFHRGVVGIVAARLVERYHRPVFVLSEIADEGVAQGSGRSIPAFHLLEALESMADLFLHYGGHKQAAGVTLPLHQVDEFRRRLNEYAAARLSPEDFQPSLEVDAEFRLEELSEQAIRDLLRLAPFGCGNPPPVLVLRDAEIPSPPVIFKERHVRVGLRQGNRTLVVKGFDFALRLAELSPGARLDAAICLRDDPAGAARGYAGWNALLLDVRTATR
jgi:single-stranded-DNA-specific exonuclease